MATTRDYYEVLNLPRDTSRDEIKRAYRRLAMKHHPDRNPGDKESEERFKECAEAYEVLSDAERRKVYDKYGHQGLRGTPGHDFSHMNPNDIFSMFGMGDILEQMFGVRVGGGRSRRQRVPTGLSLEYEVEITLEEVLHGAERDIEFKRLDVCQTCGGDGAKPGTEPVRCETCRGAGQVAQQGLGGMFRMVTACPHCNGRGSRHAENCGDCRGRGRISVKRRLSVKLPPGIHDGQAVRVTGEGEPPDPDVSPSGEGVPGDLLVVCRVHPHEIFEREGDDLLIAIPTAFAQAALGATISAPTLEEPTALEVPPGTQHGALFRIKGGGLPDLRSGRRGDLIVIIQLIVPRRLSESQKKLLQEYAETEHLDTSRNDDHPSLWKRLKDAVSGE